MLSRHQLFFTTFLFPRSTLPHRAFLHTTPPRRSATADHYETLGLESNASAGAVKKYHRLYTLDSYLNRLHPGRQFYQLSKTHHPDHNPNDPQASDRFVKISEAYAVLGNPQKRERYDLDIQRAQGGPTRHAQRGSHSSSSTPFGSRPASGLSRRRTHFKGPPPSFYRSGGWGQQSAKRQSQANAAAESAGTGDSRGGGLGPGQGQAGFANDVPHFDQEGHYRTQEQQDQRRQRRMGQESVDYSREGSMLAKFVFVTAVVTFAYSIPAMFDNAMNKRRREKT